MKLLLVLVPALAITSFVSAQETLPLETAQKAARLVTKSLDAATEAPFKVGNSRPT